MLHILLEHFHRHHMYPHKRNIFYHWFYEIKMNFHRHHAQKELILLATIHQHNSISF